MPVSVTDVPGDLVAVGRIVDAWGLRGGIKVAPHAGEPAALTSATDWWIERDGQYRHWRVREALLHGSAVRALLEGCEGRDAAQALKGSKVWVARSAFPALAEDEYYWVDLIGLDVVDVAGELLGRVRDLMDNGAHQVIVVEVAGETTSDLLIPFVAAVVRSVDLAARRVVVEWGKDY